MIVEFQNLSGERLCRAFMEQWLKRLTPELKKRRIAGLSPQSRLLVVWMDPKDMRRLNRTYRHRDYATDVLSFEPAEPGSLGELVICPQVVRRQAVEHGLRFWEELGYMLIHGVLHLLGFDHEKSEREARRMFALQDEVFEVLCRWHETGTKRKV